MYTDSGVGAATEAETLRRTRRRKRKVPDGKRLDFSIGLVGTMFGKKKWWNSNLCVGYTVTKMLNEPQQCPTSNKHP